MDDAAPVAPAREAREPPRRPPRGIFDKPLMSGKSGLRQQENDSEMTQSSGQKHDAKG